MSHNKKVFAGNENKIYNFLNQSPTPTQAQMAKKFKLSVATISEVLTRKMKKK